jgi:hypothetical protein
VLILSSIPRTAFYYPLALRSPNKHGTCNLCHLRSWSPDLLRGVETVLLASLSAIPAKDNLIQILCSHGQRQPDVPASRGRVSGFLTWTVTSVNRAPLVVRPVQGDETGNIPSFVPTVSEAHHSIFLSDSVLHARALRGILHSSPTHFWSSSMLFSSNPFSNAVKSSSATGTVA